MNRGEIWWVEHPNRKRRPWLVLARQSAIPVMQKIVAVPATSRVRHLPTEVPLGPEDGLPIECVLSLDNIRPIRKAYFVDRICALRPERMHDVCKALARATACTE